VRWDIVIVEIFTRCFRSYQAMSTGGSSSVTAQGATPRIGDMLVGGMVFFKVRDAVTLQQWWS
jgi:hypothetical protein